MRFLFLRVASVIAICACGGATYTDITSSATRDEAPSTADVPALASDNARFAFDWRNVDPFRPFNCPALPVSPTPDGMYVQTQVEYYITVNGGEYRPEPGAYFGGNFVDYPNDPWRTANCN